MLRRVFIGKIQALYRRIQMTDRVIGFFAVMVALFSATVVVAADDFSLSVTGKVTQRYILQDLGIVASPNPGIVTDVALSTDVALTRGRLTLDWWQRVDVPVDKNGSPVDHYGHRGYGDEHDITLTDDRKIGDFDLETSVAYYVLTPLSQANAGGFQIYADMGRTFDLGHGVSVTPAIRAIEFVAMSNLPTFTLLRGRLPISVPVPFLKDVTAILDPGVTGNVTPQHGQYDIVFRPTGLLVWKVSDALSLVFEAKGTNHTDPEFDVAFQYQF